MKEKKVTNKRLMGNEKGKSYVLKHSDMPCYMHILSVICFYFN